MSKRINSTADLFPTKNEHTRTAFDPMARWQEVPVHTPIIGGRELLAGESLRLYSTTTKSKKPRATIVTVETIKPHQKQAYYYELTLTDGRTAELYYVSTESGSNLPDSPLIGFREGSHTHLVLRPFRTQGEFENDLRLRTEVLPALREVRQSLGNAGTDNLRATLEALKGDIEGLLGDMR